MDTRIKAIRARLAAAREEAYGEGVFLPKLDRLLDTDIPALLGVAEAAANLEYRMPINERYVPPRQLAALRELRDALALLEEDE